MPGRGLMPCASYPRSAGRSQPSCKQSRKKLASMLHREHVGIEIGNPLLALLRDPKVAQRISDIGSDGLPEEIWIVCSQVRDAPVMQFIAHSRLTKLAK